MLNNLLILDGERLSYRTLDVEQIGSVYETMMGFHLEVAAGPVDRDQADQGARCPDDDQPRGAAGHQGRQSAAKWLKDQTDQKLTGQAADALKSADTLEDLLAALDRKIAKTSRRHIVPPGAMVLQPTEERRRTGSHYTPRSLTEPIVRTTLEPILAATRATAPTPEQILDLKVCDPAMGSGAFLVEACRQLGDALVKAWHVHDSVPLIPPDEDEVLHARRLVAQRCLYGVDKNPMAVDLAKLSLWLATLAKDHPFTFLDHALRHGDSLVGLTREQIAGVSLETRAQRLAERLSSASADPIAERMQRAHGATASGFGPRATTSPYEQLRQELGSRRRGSVDWSGSPVTWWLRRSSRRDKDRGAR